MLKKEFLDASKRFAECLLILITVPIAYFADRFISRSGWEFMTVFEFVAIATAVFFAFYSGATLFQIERKDRAFEYLLSLPIPRWKVLLNKILPRLAFMLVLVLILIPIYGFKGAKEIGGAMIVLFLISSFLSIPVNSIVISFIGAGTLFYLFKLCAKTIYYLEWHTWRKGLWYEPKSELLSQLITTTLILVPLGIAFWKTFKNMDLKPLKFQLKPYYTIALPALVIAIALVVVYFGWYLFRLYNQ